MTSDVYDILIVGGGLVGASLACALDGSGLRVALAEATVPEIPAPPSFDERNLALARASINALDALDVLREVSSGPTPIRQIHVSRRGSFGALRLDAARHGLDAFGAVIVARELGHGLERRLSRVAGLTRLRPARLRGVTIKADFAAAEIATAEGSITLKARLIVGADGTRSVVRDAVGIQARHYDYRQRLFVSVVAIERDHNHMAWERFTDEGPVALLPLSGQRMGSVCTISEDHAAAVMALDDTAYRAFLQQRFGYRAGCFGRIGARTAYPLALTCADRLFATRAVVVGNAAQTLHPVAAQGFNLGLRDALVLAEELIESAQQNSDPGATSLLARYAARRQEDRAATIAFSDGLACSMTHSSLPWRTLCSLGLVALDRLPGAAGTLVRGAMGFRGDIPRLAYGSPG